MLLGALLPGIAWLVFGFLLHHDSFLDKPAVPYLIAIAFNLMLLKYCYTHDMDRAANGVMMTTFAVTLLVFIFKMQGA